MTGGFVTLSPGPPSLYQKHSPTTLLAPTFHHYHFLHSPAREIFKLHIWSLSHPPDHKPWWLLLLLEMCSDSFARCTGVLQPRFPPCATSPLHSNHVKSFRVSVSCESILQACVINVVCSPLLLFILLVSTGHSASFEVSPPMDISIPLLFHDIFARLLFDCGFLSPCYYKLIGA